MKTSKKTAMMKNAPRFVDDTHVLVTKEFAKNAMIFGTPEYKLWREIRKDVSNAEMVTKTIKKNPNKKVDTRHMTYKNMALYINGQDNSKALMIEFKHKVATSKIQTNPYRCVLAWFIQTFEGYDDYKAFFEDKARETAEENSVFRVVSSSKSIVDDEESEDDFDFDEAVGQ